MVHVSSTQAILREKLVERIRASGNIVVPDIDRPGSLALLLQQQPAASATVAVAVLRDFDPRRFTECSVDFALSLDSSSREAWFRCYTRAIFLTGNPRNLSDRFPFHCVARDGSVAWTAPAPVETSGTLRRLLRSFDVGIPPAGFSDFTIDVPGTSPKSSTRILYIAVAGLSSAEYLVHLNHTVVEGIFLQTILPGDRLHVCPVPSLSGIEPQLISLRVHTDLHDHDRLRAYAGIACDGVGLTPSDQVHQDP